MVKVRDAKGVRDLTQLNKKKELASKKKKELAAKKKKELASKKKKKKVLVCKKNKKDLATEETTKTNDEERSEEGNEKDEEEQEEEVNENGEEEEEEVELNEEEAEVNEEEAEEEEKEDNDAAMHNEEEEELNEEEAGEEDNGAERNKNQDSSDDDVDDSQPQPPTEMFFSPTEYSKTCKIPSRCQVKATVELVETKFGEELKWFKRHSQFQHVFHMPKEPNHMVQGMWMLLVRTVKTKKREECWFVVNGVPIRYSMREHALLTGFACHEYPENWKQLGSERFALRVFKKQKGIRMSRMSHVVQKLEKMKKHCADRLRLVVLYFLCKVIKAKVKADGIDPFLLRIVDDLSACESFPWGRYTFEDSLDGIRSVMNKLNGVVKRDSQPCFPGFIIPLEILAFESIPSLGRKFREVAPSDNKCPRMCKHQFNKEFMRGFITLDDIYETLGDTKEIFSILEPDSEERTLLAGIVGDEVDDGIGCIDNVVVDSWREHLIEKREKIWWKGMYEEDIASRENRNEQKENVDVENVSGGDGSGFTELKELIEKEFRRVVEQFRGMEVKVDAKLGEIGSKVTEIQKVVMGNTNFFNGEADTPNVVYGHMFTRETDDVMALSTYRIRDVTGAVTDPPPPRIVDVTEEQEQREDKQKKENEAKVKKSKKREGEEIETGKKRCRKAPRKFTPGTISKKNGKKKG